MPVKDVSRFEEVVICALKFMALNDNLSEVSPALLNLFSTLSL